MTVKELRAVLLDVDQDLEVMVDDAAWPGPTRVLAAVSALRLQVVRNTLSPGVMVDHDFDDMDAPIDGAYIRHAVVLS